MTSKDEIPPKSISETLSRVRTALHTPESAGVLIFDYLLSQATTVGTLSANNNVVDVPMSARIQVVRTQGIQQASTTITCVTIGPISICVEKQNQVF